MIFSEEGFAQFTPVCSFNEVVPSDKLVDGLFAIECLLFLTSLFLLTLVLGMISGWYLPADSAGERGFLELIRF